MKTREQRGKQLAAFAKKRPFLFWYTKNFDGLSEAAVVEAVLNEGNWEDVQTLIRLLGRQKVGRVFQATARRPRSNYRPAIKYFFKLYFAEHA
jgi:hypothetical protein